MPDSDQCSIPDSRRSPGMLRRNDKGHGTGRPRGGLHATMAARRDAEGDSGGMANASLAVGAGAAHSPSADDPFFLLSHDLLVEFDGDGRASRLNPAWERVLGRPVEDLLGRRLVDLVHPDDAG